MQARWPRPNNAISCSGTPAHLSGRNVSGSSKTCGFRAGNQWGSIACKTFIGYKYSQRPIRSMMIKVPLFTKTVPGSGRTTWSTRSSVALRGTIIGDAGEQEKCQDTYKVPEDDGNSRTSLRASRKQKNVYASLLGSTYCCI